jgi:hypothetical protein
MTIGSPQISWGVSGLNRTGSEKKTLEPVLENRPDFSAHLHAGQAEIAGSGNHLPGNPVFLGRVTRQAPTVSHLLVQGPYKDACWDILGKKVNADKPFTRIPEGETIYMDPDTCEILWGKQVDVPQSAAPAPLAPVHVPAQATLAGHFDPGAGQYRQSPAGNPGPGGFSGWGRSKIHGHRV